MHSEKAKTALLMVIEIQQFQIYSAKFWIIARSNVISPKQFNDGRRNAPNILTITDAGPPNSTAS
jgi:hypothetical protein